MKTIALPLLICSRCSPAIDGHTYEAPTTGTIQAESISRPVRAAHKSIYVRSDEV
jgi:hypothetical protein